MIKKILKIKNFGKYLSFTVPSGDWNGSFTKVNTIYAENGSGKTTLTQLFKSLKGDNKIVTRKKSFKATGEIEVEFLDQNNSQLTFQDKKWNRKVNKIEAFDSLFTENNVYLISLGNYDKNIGISKYKFVFGEEGVRIYNKIVNLRSERKKQRNKRSRLNYKLKKSQENSIRKNKLQRSLSDLKEQGNEIDTEIPKLERQLIKIAEDFGTIYLDKINSYLKYFNPQIQLTRLNKKGLNFVYHLSISDELVRSDSDSISLKHTLSEGDKSSLALSFFLARISLLDDIHERVIIFDDPISSFDSGRRNVTINHLKKIAIRSKQFFLLSHDLNFIKSFNDKIEVVTNLKIVSNGIQSKIVRQDVGKETMTGIFKDLTVLHEYLDSGATTFSEKRETVRCIRPVIEGVFRIKYYGKIKPDEWLGDFIGYIRNAENGELFYNLKESYDELSDINDYSKEYHHSNPNYLEVPINDEELRNYVLRTIDVLRKI